MANGWEGVGESNKKAYWNANLDIFQFNKFSGLDVELRLVTRNPFTYSTHWFYKELEDAWLNANDRDRLKAKYNGKLSGKMGPPKRSFECPDFDHDTKLSRMSECECCTTYNKFMPYPEKTILFQAFWRIPSATNPQLQKWQKCQVFSFNHAAAQKLSTVIRQQGANIDDFQHGYTIYVTFNAGQGAATWNVAFCQKLPLTPQMIQHVKENEIDFASIYEPGTPAELQQILGRLGYEKLLDPNFDPSNVGGGGARGGQQAPGGYGAQGSYGGQQRRPAAGGQQRPAYQPPVDDGFGDQGDFGAQPSYAPQAGYQDGGYEPSFDGGAGDFDAGGGDFGGASAGFEQGGFEPSGFEPGGDDFAPSGDDFDAPPLPPVGRAPAAQRPSAPPPRQAAPQRPAAPPQRPAAPPPQRQAGFGAPQRPAAPPQRPGAPGAPRPGAPRQR